MAAHASILYRLQNENPVVSFIPANTQAKCKNMQRTNLNNALGSLQEMSGEVKVADDIRGQAHQAVERTIQLD